MQLAIIPARGGSKRIPRKNIKNFCGKPMLYYAIEAIKKTKMFSDIIVSTDDLEIKEMALELGAKVPFLRPKNLSDDFTPTQPVIAHAIKECLDRKADFESVCCVYPAVPLITSNDIKEAFNLHKRNSMKYCFPIVEFSPPIEQALKINKNNQKLLPLFPGYELERTQDIKKTYFDAGQFYWGEKDLWLNEANIIGNGVGYILPSWRTVDIDNLDDWKRAELMYKSINNN
jgi:pseudaminic acid cytidylyltransferase